MSMSIIALSLCAVVAPISDAERAETRPPIRFVEPAEIAASASNAIILDTRPIGAYLAAHIPGAVHIDDECLRSPRAGLPVQYCPLDELARTLGALGVSFERPVVVYADKDDPLAATMAAYALARIGHDDVAIISGGFGAWAANHETTKAFPTLQPVALTAREPTIESITLDEFRHTVGFDEFAFIDARPAPQHRGDEGVWPRNGHIPGAHSLDWKRLTEPDNHHRLLPNEKLKSIVEELGLSAWDDIVVYCGTGREATLLTIALTCQLGWDGVRLYEGSWTEYTTDPDAPVEVGPRQEPKTMVHTEGRFHIAGQPSKQDLRNLAAQGVKTVVSCRTSREMASLDFDEAAFLEGLGVRYVHIPMGGHDGYEPSQLRALRSALDGAEGDVLLHCSAGGRARTLWMAHLVEHEGVDINEAMRRGIEMGGRESSLEGVLGQRVSYRLEAE